MIAVLPYETRYKGKLADVPLDELNWPIGGPDRTGFVGDLRQEDHLIVYPRTKHFWDPRLDTRCRISLIMPEPYVIHRRNYRLAILLQKRFCRLITHRPAMTQWTSNALLMPFGGAWVDPSRSSDINKCRNISLIASGKKSTHGHRLRHEIADWSVSNAQDIDLLGLAYRPIETKEEGLLDYRHSVIIENARESGYFTEKLIDCLLCETVPIY